MDIGIGLPNAVRGVERDGVVDWARRAEQAGFASLGTLDRIVFPNFESLIALAAAAAVTERIALVTDILIAPLRSNTALMAKQAATIDRLSGGRLVLGLSPGGREDDYELSGVPFSSRGARFDEQLAELRPLWRSERGVGPPPGREGRPVVLVGGSADAAFRRAARHGDGWTMGGGTPEMFADALAKLRAAWRPRRARASRARWCCSTSPSATAPPRPPRRRCTTTTPGWATTRGPWPTARPPTRTRSAGTYRRSRRSAWTR
jgi:alkanesulfonate monooxygenase SsuD/methylene tetrahydromethanopterin reductase-like flavin-dependent oxidoreductase (luciferase family)